MTLCRYGSQYCYKVSDEHHRKYSHTGRKHQSTCRLFHGTKYENAESILQNGLRESPDGRLGKGVYLTTKKWAHRIAAHRGNGINLCVIELEVKLGNVKVLHGQQEDRNGTWSRHDHCDSCRTTHPAWPGLKPEKPFKEIGNFTANGTIQHCNQVLAIGNGMQALATSMAGLGQAFATASAVTL
ncbi:unnamed protein product [Didymodactylos carnosus]|uniref:PARP catalytic domain-containing protein n=1 Tax=Didymodactylos carnosus TaxID=1234261 RepID=A0A815WEY9_9BILA|nr:unnamed protein product [Didymodactylos carnosus]CAF4402844.1 unnamed protein product [Didymodactylos carnosus]